MEQRLDEQKRYDVIFVIIIGIMLTIIGLSYLPHPTEQCEKVEITANSIIYGEFQEDGTICLHLLT